ncbi:hypothetical protein GH714_038292 [Hevea brasiliensis]|uniref:Uncharacterized protein n=1 Tax=Hevea brasiliensis TaxID=3981 RepID=A0A6A6L4X2_HEVBR|nr:hypothetical protein GH714_038292 [Hevea brasiliensis]
MGILRPAHWFVEPATPSKPYHRPWSLLYGISTIKYILCWCFPGIKKLVTKIASFAMLGIIITTFVVMGFALVVTHKGNGRVIPRASYDKPALQDYSKSLQRYVSVSRWLPITRALMDSQTCTDFPKTPIQVAVCDQIPAALVGQRAAATVNVCQIIIQDPYVPSAIHARLEFLKT